MKAPTVMHRHSQLEAMWQAILHTGKGFQTTRSVSSDGYQVYSITLGT